MFIKPLERFLLGEEKLQSGKCVLFKRLFLNDASLLLKKYKILSTTKREIFTVIFHILIF